MGDRHGEVHWSELMTRDPQAARAFFETVCGWTVAEMPMGPGAPYLVCHAGGVPVAGIMAMEGAEFDGMPPHWFTYLAVDDADLAVERAAEAGGAVVKPCFDVPGVGRIAIVRDPSGAVVGLMTPAAR